MNLTFIHIAKLLQKFLAVIATVFPWQPGRPGIHIVVSNTCVEHELKILSYS